MKTKYDLDWTVSHIDRDFVIQEPDTVLRLIVLMKQELDNRKEVIESMREKELLREAIKYKEPEDYLPPSDWT